MNKKDVAYLTVIGVIGMVLWRKIERVKTYNEEYTNSAIGDCYDRHIELQDIVIKLQKHVLHLGDSIYR